MSGRAGLPIPSLVLRRLRRDEAGFGLIELIMALVVLNVGVLATVAALNSGAVALRRASQISTATALADAQLEQFRAVKYAVVGLDPATVAAADANATYKDDAARAYPATMPSASCTQDGSFPDYCVASQAVTGGQSPDSKPYRVDTYVTEGVPAGTTGRAVRTVTVVVRDGRDPAKTLVRTQSTFDQSTGS